jgi:hypothetical protein
MKKIVFVLLVCTLIFSFAGSALADQVHNEAICTHEESAESDVVARSRLCDNCNIGIFVTAYTTRVWTHRTFGPCPSNPGLTDRLEWYQVTDALECNNCHIFGGYNVYAASTRYHDHPEA